MRLYHGLLLGVLVACGGGSSYSTNPPPGPPPPPPPPAAGTVFVTISDNLYTPDTTTIAAGTPVRWTNTGAAVHSAKSDTGSAISSGGLAGPSTDSYGAPVAGATYTKTFSQAGTFAYHCEFHPSMHAVVVVTP
jgi:plastocyanin